MAIDLSVNNNSRYYSVPDHADLSFPDTDWFLAIWMRVEENEGSAFQYIFSNNMWDSAESLNWFVVENSSSDSAKGQMYARPESLGGLTTGIRIDDGLDRLVVAQRVGSNVEVKTCVAYGSVVQGDVLAYSSGQLNGGVWNIGRRVDGNASRYYKEHFGDVIKGHVSLTNTQIEALAAGENPETVIGTVNLDVWFPFTEASATVTDLINGHVATRNGTGLITSAPFPAGVAFAVSSSQYVEQLLEHVRLQPASHDHALLYKDPLIIAYEISVDYSNSVFANIEYISLTEFAAYLQSERLSTREYKSFVATDLISDLALQQSGSAENLNAYSAQRQATYDAAININNERYLSVNWTGVIQVNFSAIAAIEIVSTFVNGDAVAIDYSNPYHTGSTSPFEFSLALQENQNLSVESLLDFLVDQSGSINSGASLLINRSINSEYLKTYSAQNAVPVAWTGLAVIVLSQSAAVEFLAEFDVNETIVSELSLDVKSADLLFIEAEMNFSLSSNTTVEQLAFLSALSNAIVENGTNIERQEISSIENMAQILSKNNIHSEWDGIAGFITGIKRIFLSSRGKYKTLFSSQGRSKTFGEGTKRSKQSTPHVGGEFNQKRKS
tara:strand:+ start:7678 stop:9513 length:1836 start_codon:yes stop_codon:yes gene_type:complete